MTILTQYEPAHSVAALQSERGSTWFEWAPGLWARFRAWFTEQFPAMAQEDWTEPIPAAVPAAEHAPQQAPAPRPRPVHPPFAPQPAHCAHVAIRMQRVLLDASWDPTLTPTKLAGLLGALNAELSEMVRAEQSMKRRMDANRARAEQMGRGLDAMAGAPGLALKTETVTGPDGAEREVIPDIHAAMQTGSARVADPEPTQQMPPITDDMPDPRVAALPVEESPGDVELSKTPVHGNDVLPPVPSEPFLAEPEQLPVREVEPDRPWMADDAAETDAEPKAGAAL